MKKPLPPPPLPFALSSSFILHPSLRPNEYNTCNMKRLAVCLILGCLLATCRSQAPKNEQAHTFEIAVVPKSQSLVFWQSVHAGAEAAAQELKVKVLWNGPASETDFAPQINIVEDFMNRGVDAIALAPNHGKALAPVVEKAMQQSIPVLKKSLL